MEQILVGLDIGTSKICTVIGKINNSGDLEILGRGMNAFSGIKKGVVSDIENTSRAIKCSIEQAERDSNTQIKSAYVSVSGMHTDIFESRFSLDIEGDRNEITKRDIENLQIITRAVKIPEDQQIIDIIPKQYILDGNEGICEPIGMFGKKLEMDTDIIICKSSIMQNLVRSVERAGLKIDGLVIEALAIESVTYEEELKNGVVIIDVGGSITNVSVYKDGSLIFFGAIPLGGDHITNDSSIGFNLHCDEAERIKGEYGMNLSSVKNSKETIIVKDLSDGAEKFLKLNQVVEVIEERVHEIFTMSKALLKTAGMNDGYVLSAVLTGRGISFIDGCREIVSTVFNIPSRIVSGKQNGIQQIEYFIASGMIKYVNENIESGIGSDVAAKSQNEGNKGILSKIFAIITDIFRTY